MPTRLTEHNCDEVLLTARRKNRMNKSLVTIPAIFERIILRKQGEVLNYFRDKWMEKPGYVSFDEVLSEVVLEYGIDNVEVS